MRRKILIRMKSQLLLFALLLSATPLTAQEPGTAPAYWFENVPAGDDSIQSSLVFRTIPGVQYTVETSHDLTNWTELESIYGMAMSSSRPCASSPRRRRCHPARHRPRRGRPLAWFPCA